MRNLENQPLTARGDTISSGLRVRYCTTCEGKIRSKNPKKEFCRDRCRLLHWAVKVLIKESKAGRANGLRSLIRELCE